MTTFTHKGIEITLDEKGKFSATINNKRQYAPSLPAIKKRIDGAQSFEPFDALVERSYIQRDESPILKVRVIGIKNVAGKKSWNNRDEWVIEGGNRTYAMVIRDTPEAEAAFLASTAASKETYRLKRALEQERLAIQNKLDEKLTWEAVPS